MNSLSKSESHPTWITLPINICEKKLSILVLHLKLFTRDQESLRKPIYTGSTVSTFISWCFACQMCRETKVIYRVLLVWP